MERSFMNGRSLKPFPFILLFMFLMSQAYAQTTGKIVGTVKDANTGDVLPGVNVIIVGTYLGAATDLEGYYTVINVPAGIYDLQVTMMGYKKVTQVNVRVSVDQITTANFSLEPEVMEGEEVIVVAERDILHKEVTNSQLVVSGTEMVEAAGIRTINHYLEKQAGITGTERMEIRGGSADQTGSIINGLTFVNPRIGKAEARIPVSAVEQVNLVTGGYGAEYGNFRSGLINVVTKSGDKKEYHGSVNYSRNDAHMKRFGKSLYDPTNVFLRTYFDPEWAFVGTTAAWAGNKYPEDETEKYIPFNGWNRIAQAYNRSVPADRHVTPMDLYLWSAWVHTVEPDFNRLKAYADTAEGLEYNLTDKQIQALKDHAHEPEGSDSDYNVDFGFGGPVPLVSSKLGDATFYLSHQTINTNYIQPVTLNAEKDATTMLTVKSNITKSLTMDINGIYRLVHGTAPVMPTAGAVPRIGDDYDADSGGGDLMFENNIGKIYDQGMVYFWHPTFWHPKDLTTYMGGIKLNQVVNPKTFWDLTLSYAWQKDFAEPEVTRDYTTLINFGPIWLDEMPYGRVFTADTVRNPDDANDYYVHSIFEDVGGEILSATGRRFSSKTGMYNENSVTQQFRLKFDLSSQATKHHFFKTGFDFNYYDLDNDLWVYWTGYDTDYDLRFHVKPYQAGLYVQDQMTYEGLVARIGLRADYYNSGNLMWPTGDRFNGEAFIEGPEGEHPAMDQYRYEFMKAGHNLVWNRWNRIHAEYQEAFPEREFLKRTENHFALSPRVGLSFPVTDRSKFYFNYGHFRSTVPYSEMYMYNFRYSKGQGLTSIGNPNLAPPRTISYELGVSYNLLDQYLININGFYKDVTGQHTDIQFDGVSISDGYSSRTNNEYEDIQGMEVDIRKPAGKFITGWVNFRYLLEKTGRVGREYYYEDPERNNDPLEIYYEADEDQPAPQPKLAANLTFHVPADLKFGKTVNTVLGDWLVSGIFEWEQGEAFTHNPRQLRNVSNNLRWPDYYMVDLKVSKMFGYKGIKVNFYVDIQNVLDLKVDWMHYGWTFRSNIDQADYLNSLHLPMYDSPEYKGQTSPSGNEYVGGDDKIGDLKSASAPYINDPNNGDLWMYGYPRDIWFGVNINF